MLLQVGALAIVISFYTAYVTKQRLLKKQGIQTHRLGRGDKPKKTFYIEALLMGTTFLMVPAQLVSIIGAKWWLLLEDQIGLRILGLVLGALGVVMFVTAMVEMKANWRAGVDATQKTEFVDGGVYQISRNPAFVGFDLFYIGIGLAFMNPIHSILVVAAIILLHLQILEEEKFLTKAFGKTYKDYQKKVGRYF